MTSAPIMEMPQAGFAPSQSTVKTGGSTEAMQFSKAMDFASTGGQTTMSEGPAIQGSQTDRDVKTHVEKTVAENAGRKEIRHVDDANEAEAVSEEEAVEEIAEKTEEIVEEIAEELDVTPEEVEEAMEALGLTVMDLLLQGNVAALVAELKGMQSVELLTDADLFSQISQLTEGVQEELKQLADSLGMSVDELEQTIKQQIQAAEEMPVSEEIPQQAVVTDAAVDDVEVSVMVEEALSEQVPAGEKKVDSQKVISETKTGEKTAATEEMAAAEETDGLVHDQSETGNSDFRGFREESGQQRESDHLQENQQGGLLLGSPLTNDLSTAGNLSMDNLFTGEFDLQQTRELIDQIADYVRVHHSEKVSSMEIQLNPASLGTVNLQVVAKNGVISAQLTAQDEAVRTALESQVTQLKESLEAQGLKVSAVEVTAQSHAFEQNLQQGQGKEEQADRPRKSARKILNLDELNQEEMLEEEMSDAERLQIEMMRMGGNKLNFRV